MYFFSNFTLLFYKNIISCVKLSNQKDNLILGGIYWQIQYFLFQLYIPTYKNYKVLCIKKEINTLQLYKISQNKFNIY